MLRGCSHPRELTTSYASSSTWGLELANESESSASRIRRRLLGRGSLRGLAPPITPPSPTIAGRDPDFFLITARAGSPERRKQTPPTGTAAPTASAIRCGTAHVRNGEAAVSALARTRPARLRSPASVRYARAHAFAVSPRKSRQIGSCRDRHQSTRTRDATISPVSIDCLPFSIGRSRDSTWKCNRGTPSLAPERFMVSCRLTSNELGQITWPTGADADDPRPSFGDRPGNDEYPGGRV